ncbi:MAG: PepSY domain-containing protein [Candidatus Limnocylindria bacterium]
MNLKRLRDPLVAALAALLIGGVSVAMANNHGTPTDALAVNAEEPAGGSDTDTLEEGDQTGADNEAAEDTEADEAGPEEQEPNYAGTATIAVDESTMPEDEAAEAAALAGLATVSQDAAEAAALAAVSGDILQAELDNENGFVLWSIEVRDAAGIVHDVKIDAGNAAVLGTEAGEDEAGD